MGAQRFPFRRQCDEAKYCEELPQWDLQWIHAFDAFEAGEFALTNFRREVQTIHLVGVMVVNVRFPSIDRWNVDRATSVAMTKRGDARRCGRGRW